MSVDIDKLRQAQPMYQAFINLFQYLNNDTMLKSIGDESIKSGVRQH